MRLSQKPEETATASCEKATSSNLPKETRLEDEQQQLQESNEWLASEGYDLLQLCNEQAGVLWDRKRAVQALCDVILQPCKRAILKPTMLTGNGKLSALLSVGGEERCLDSCAIYLLSLLKISTDFWMEAHATASEFR